VYCGGLDIYTKWCAQTFPPIFELFTIFDSNFSKIFAPHSKNYLGHLKRAIPSEKNSENGIKIDP